MTLLRSIFSIALILFISSAPMPSAIATDATSAGSIGIRIAQIPAAVAEDPFSDVYIVSRLQPGTSLMQRLEVFNTSSEDFRVSIYPGAATFIEGSFEVTDGRTGNLLTDWIKLSPNLLLVKPGESKTFNMVITTPSSALSTQQFGVIWAEVQGSPNAEGITTVSRVGIRMYIPIGDAPAITIAKSNLDSSTNQIVVKKSTSFAYSTEITYISISLNIILLILLMVYLRRYPRDRKELKEQEMRDKNEWREEKRRRAELARRVNP